MVRRALSKPSGVIRVKELEAVTDLSNEGIDGYVKTLSDLDMMPNLQSLILDGENMMMSVSQLSGKAKLKTLILSGCDLDSAEINVLGSLAALETLDLSDNNITSLSMLANVTTLKFVYLANNSIDDISALSASKEITLMMRHTTVFLRFPTLTREPLQYAAFRVELHIGYFHRASLYVPYCS